MSRPLKKTGFSQGLYQQSSTAKERLGTMRWTMDGRCFRYALAGAANLSKGYMSIAPDVDSNTLNEVQTGKGAAVGDYVVNVLITTGLTVVANEFAGGYLITNDVANEGQCHEIESNEAMTGTSLYLTLVDPLVEAIGVTVEASVHKNPWWKVVEHADEENFPTGVPLIDVTAAYYFWAQTHGPANVLQAATAGTYGGQMVLGGTAGSVMVPSATNDGYTMARIGTKFGGLAVSTEFNIVFLQID